MRSRLLLVHKCKHEIAKFQKFHAFEHQISFRRACPAFFKFSFHPSLAGEGDNFSGRSPAAPCIFRDFLRTTKA